MPRAIKVEFKNHLAIETALRAVNGKKDSHTFCTYFSLARIMTEAEEKIAALSIAKKYRAGATYIAQSGEELPSAYKYSAATTTVTIARTSGGWYITDIKASTLYPRSKPVRSLHITQEQDAIAIAAIRNGYKII